MNQATWLWRRLYVPAAYLAFALVLFWMFSHCGVTR